MYYFQALILTIIIEFLIVYILGFRNKLLFKSLVIVNIITNPALNFIVKELNKLFIGFSFVHIVILEMIVVIIEWYLLKLMLKDNQLPLFKLSFIINASSFLTGLWLGEFLII